ncbi:cellulose binding domain-containing protein [Micromonospora sp. SL4-19]|uniref:cellulose binding domain-containing protein n=1 Tax=Micromonospora sp. SL4-19 TaxID=3399129 RepID=UPI003A4E0853
MFGTRRARSSPGAAIVSSPWIVVAIGVIVMVVLLVVALNAARDRRTYAETAPPDPAMPLPQVSTTTESRPPTSAAGAEVPGQPPRSTKPPSRSTPNRSTGAAAGSGRPAPPPAPLSASSSPVTGRYKVVDAFDGGFIGEVLLVNTGGSPSGWTVRLSFARGRLAGSWVEGAEQGSASFADGVFTYRSGVDLAPGVSVPLRFHFENTGTTRPASCAVGTTACSGL